MIWTDEEIVDEYEVIGDYPPFKKGDIIREWFTGIFSITANFTMIDKGVVVNNPNLFKKL